MADNDDLDVDAVPFTNPDEESTSRHSQDEPFQDPYHRRRDGRPTHPPPQLDWRPAVAVSATQRTSPDGRSPDSDNLGRDLRKGVERSVERALSDEGRSSASSHTPSDLDLSTISLSQASVQEEDVSDEDIENYRLKMPDRLKVEYYDAMIIYYDDDREDVQALIDRFHKDVLLLKTHTPRLALYDEIVPGSAGTTLFAEIDYSLTYCTFNLPFITKGFCSDIWDNANVSSQICMAHAIAERKWSVVPIFTEQKRKQAFKIPPSINSLKGIQFWDQDKFHDSLRKLLEEKVHLRLEKEEERKHERKNWIRQERGKEARKEEERRQKYRQTNEDEKVKDKENQLRLQAMEKQHQRRQHEIHHNDHDHGHDRDRDHDHDHDGGGDRAPLTTTINYIQNPKLVMIGQDLSAANERGCPPLGQGQVARRDGNAPPADPASLANEPDVDSRDGNAPSSDPHNEPMPEETTYGIMGGASSSLRSQLSTGMIQSRPMDPSPSSVLARDVTVDGSWQSSEPASLGYHSLDPQP